MAHEGLGDFHMALENYHHAHSYIQRNSPTSKYHSVQYWISVILYRLCLLSLRLQNPLQAIENFRRYKRYADTSFGTQFGFHERLTVYYWYWRTLSDIIRSKVEQGPIPNDTNAEMYYFLNTNLTIGILKQE